MVTTLSKQTTVAEQELVLKRLELDQKFGLFEKDSDERVELVLSNLDGLSLIIGQSRNDRTVLVNLIREKAFDQGLVGISVNCLESPVDSPTNNPDTLLIDLTQCSDINALMPFADLVIKGESINYELISRLLANQQPSELGQSIQTIESIPYNHIVFDLSKIINNPSLLPISLAYIGQHLVTLVEQCSDKPIFLDIDELGFLILKLEFSDVIVDFLSTVLKLKCKVILSSQFLRHFRPLFYKFPAKDLSLYLNSIYLLKSLCRFSYWTDEDFYLKVQSLRREKERSELIYLNTYAIFNLLDF